MIADDVLMQRNLIEPLHNELLKEYKLIESHLRINQIDKKVSYVSPVNFIESMELPRHSWFPYKEGFSPSFVKNFINKHIPASKNGLILDPFSGVGTTSLVAAGMGRRAMGLDVSPLSTFVAQTKSTILTKSERSLLADTIKQFKTSELNEKSAPPENETVKKYYEPLYLASLLRVRGFIDLINSVKVRDLFFLAYLSVIEEFSTHRKAGNGVKKKTKLNYSSEETIPVEQIRNKILDILGKYYKDIENTSLENNPTYRLASSIDIESYSDIDTISGVITSPPYANCFDYSKIYMRELWFGDFFKTKEDQKEFRSNSVRSHVHASWEDRYPEYSNSLVDTIVAEILNQQKLWSNKISSMLSGYFKDISRVIDLIGAKSDTGTRVGFVVSNSFYGGIPIATDLLISQCAARLGFKTVSIDVYRGMIPSSQQYRLIEDKYFMRESLVVLEKI